MLPLSFVDRLISIRDKHPVLLACHNREEEWNYDTFYGHAIGISNALMENQSERIGIVMDHNLITYSAIIGTWLAGKTFIPIDIHESESLRKQKISECGVDMILFEDRYESLVHETPSLNLSEISVSNTLVPIAYNPTQPAYILSTSGTTGNPKHIPISYENLSCFVDSFIDMCPELNHDHRFVQWSPLKYDMSIISYLIPLCLGASFRTMVGPSLPHIEAYHAICDKKLDVVVTTPSAMVMNKPFLLDMNFEHVQYTFFGAELLELELVEFWKQYAPNSQNFNLYGPSEAGIFATYFPIERSERHLKIPIGLPVKHMETRIEPLGEDTKYGELWLSGAQVFDGYLDDNLNAESFQILGTKRWYKTGDIVRKNDVGIYHFAGRNDSQIKVAGKRVNLDGLGAFLQRYGFKKRFKYYESKNLDGLSLLTLVVEGSESDSRMIRSITSEMPRDLRPNRIEYVRDIDRIEIKNHQMTEL